MPRSERGKAICKENSRRWYARQNDSKRMHMAAKRRAKVKGLEFDIDVEDIVVPTHCPVLGIPLYRGNGVQSYNSPSLDRIDNDKGYVKGNVAVVSTKFNRMKTDMTTKQVERFYNYVFGLQNE